MNTDVTSFLARGGALSSSIGARTSSGSRSSRGFGLELLIGVVDQVFFVRHVCCDETGIEKTEGREEPQESASSRGGK